MGTQVKGHPAAGGNLEREHPAAGGHLEVGSLLRDGYEETLLGDNGKGGGGSGWNLDLCWKKILLTEPH